MEKIKNYLKFSVLLIAISSIIYACQKEDIDNFDNSDQQKTNPYDISFSSFKEKTSIYNLNTFLKKKTNQNTNRENDELSFQDFIIDTSVVKQFALDDTRISYSFKINLIENNAPDTTYNLFIRQLDNQWVSSIFMFVDDNDSSNDKRFSSIQEVNSYNGIYNPSASRGGSWEETTIYHCTYTGPSCTSGVCDLCYQCVSYTTTYVSFTTYGEDPHDSGGGTIDGGMYNGGGGGAGSSNNQDDSEEEENKNCEKLKKLVSNDSLGSNILPIVNQLRTKLEAGNNEWSISYKNVWSEYGRKNAPDDNGIEEGSSETRSEYSYGNIWIGQIHTHPEDTYSIFSWLDLKALKTIDSVSNDNFNDEVFLMVVAPNNITYALRVSNLDILSAKIQEDIDNAEGQNDIEKRDNIMLEMAEDYKKSTNLEQTFLDLYGGYGISLYEATDSILSNWKELKLDKINNNIVNEVNCN